MGSIIVLVLAVAGFKQIFFHLVVPVRKFKFIFEFCN